VAVEPTPADQFNASTTAPTASQDELPPAEAGLPYLGVSVQYIESNDTPGAEVHGLEVVRVDPNSPAEKAGLRGQGELTKMGASGATAGEMMAPLNLILMPLLKKAGELGDDGDMIVAIDDTRVDNDSALANALQPLKPGDTIYLTIVRLHQDSRHETLKVPIKLGAPRDATGHLVDDSAGLSGSRPTVPAH
ncbi:MAG: PDZ domain-containing protein, partial [Candidatus Binataceae bacterium]